MSILLASCLMLASCATYNSLPSTATTQEKETALLQDAVSFLSNQNTQDVFKQSLILGGNEAMKNAVDDADRKEIANLMYSVANAFYSLANGDNITADQLNKTIANFTSAQDVSKYSEQIAAFNLTWALVYPKLKLVGDKKLIVDYTLLLADAAQKVAAGYKSN